ncbi:MAG TPA: SRPBCC family protein [Gemmatimonadaceae bacterium]|nr:SRPBCC family protein [Gemmatimonadaceae bacterium]
MVLETRGPRRVPQSATKDDIDWASFDPPGDSDHNVGRAERIGSVALGAALVGLGIRRRDPAGLVAALFGGYFVARGATGRCPVYRSLGVSTGAADAVLGSTHRDDVTSRAATVNARKAVKVERSVTIDKPREELFAFWRNFENLPRFMEHLVSVRVDSAMRSRWEAKAPAGRTVEWDAEIVNEVPNEIIAWKSIGEPDVPNAGSVNFSDAPGGRGTIVRVTLDWEPPAGRIGAMLSHFFSEEPDQQIREDLRKFKQLMETGEITTSARRVEDSAYVGATPQA